MFETDATPQLEKEYVRVFPRLDAANTNDKMSSAPTIPVAV